MRKVFVSVLLFSFLALSCGGSALVVSGETLKASGNQFIKTAATYKNGCDVTKTIPQTDCQSFREFAVQFQKSYAIARQLWEAARATNDPETQKGAEAVVKTFDAKLNAFDAKVPKK